MTARRLTVFWGNQRVTHAAIIADQREATQERMAGAETVLLVQDTTSFDFSHHPAADGMGPLDNEHCRGFFAHSTLAVSRVGVPLGVLGQRVWVRLDSETGKAAQRHERAFEDQESYKWVEGLPELPAEGQFPALVTVADRESHIYEFLDEVLNRDMDFIVRAMSGRSFSQEGEDIFALMQQQPVQHRYTLALHRRPDRDARDAQMAVRFATVVLRRPARATLTVQVVEVIETDPPAGEEAVHWLLLTSLPVQTVEQALTIVRFYTYRWLVERFHYTLKSGCKLEESQLRQEKRLERLLALYSLVAWKLLWLTYQARQTPDAPCTLVLQTAEWQALYAFVYRTQRLPTIPPLLHTAIRWIAQLGGFLGRKGDGNPGVKVLWRGWMRLQDFAATWALAHPPQKDVGNA